MFVECLIGCVIVIILWVLNRKPDGLPPGEWGWPVIGSLPSQKVPLSNYIEKYIKKHGKTFTWRIGSRTVVFLCDYKIIKSAFSNPLLNNRPRIFSFDFLSLFRRLGMANCNGTQFHNLRRFTLRHLRDSGMGKSSLEEVISYEVECLINDLLKHTDKVTEVPLSLQVAITNVIWGISAGSRYDVEDEKFQAYQKLNLELCEDFQSSVFLMYDVFPWLHKLIPNKVKAFIGLPKAETFHRANKFLAFLKEYITEHKKTIEYNDDPRDFIDSYLIELKKNEEGKYSENTSTFSESELLITLLGLFGAGTHTTSGTIKWAIIYLIKYPEVQRKIQQQIDEVVPEHRLPGLEDREKLPYLEATICEVMRIKTIVPLGVYHCAQEDTNIENFRIPKGTVIISAIEVCHSDQDYWENPQEFNPDRFLLPDGTVDSKKEGFIAFSTGRRVCPGEELARMELYLFISGLLQKFSFSAPEKVDVVMEPDPLSPNFVTPKPFQMIIRERKAQSEKGLVI